MKRIVITDTNEFERIITEFEQIRNNIQNVFTEEKNNIEKINDENVWNGKTQEIIYQKHLDFQKNFSPIEEALEIYINFLKNSLQSYKDLENNINQNINTASEELNVNS